MIDAYSIRKIILEQCKRADVGHIGPALSIADILAVLYDRILFLPKPDHANRDRFILSKGHAALALFAALFLKGFVTKEQLDSYCTDGSLLGVHPEIGLPGVEFSTGSLGQGLSVGAGMALAARMKGERHRIFVLVSDAECNEGALWETVMFAAHHKLSRLVAIVDNDGQQALGKTKDVLDLSPLGDKWKSFGWEVYKADGHNIEDLTDVLKGLNTETGPPKVVVADTICGKGVSFMEGKVAWHYLPMNDEQYSRALRDIEANR